MSLIEKWRSQAIKKHIPLQASLELTNKCNERCTHCYLPTFKDDSSRVLKLQDWYKILEELRSAGTLYLILMGGEAMLNPLFWDIANRAKSLGFHTSMISNGTLIRSSDVALRLKAVGIQVVTFSVYSLSDKIHDGMTSVKGSLKKTLAAIDHCIDMGVDVTVNCLATKENIESIFSLYDYCLDRGIDMKVDPAITSKLNGDMSPTKYRASEKQLEEFFKTRAKRWKKSLQVPVVRSPEIHVCNAGKGKCAVTAYGELLPCIEIRESLGSLVEKNFHELWDSPKIQPWREFRVSQANHSLNEKEYSLCDHCPGMSKNETGDGRTVLNFSQLVAKIKYRVWEDCK